MTVATYILLCTALFLHLVFDLHKQKEKKPIVHWLSATLVVCTSFALGFVAQFFSDYPWWRFAFYSLMIHLVLFDYMWNWFHDEAWYYHGDVTNPKRAWTDKMWNRVPPLGELLFKIIFLILGYLVYYNWDQIISS